LAERLLRLAVAPGVGTCPAGPASASVGAGIVRGEPQAIREPAYPRGPDGAAGPRQSQESGAADAGGRPGGAGAATLQVDDHQRPRPASGGESPGSALRGRKP